MRYFICIEFNNILQKVALLVLNYLETQSVCAPEMFSAHLISARAITVHFFLPMFYSHLVLLSIGSGLPLHFIDFQFSSFI